MPPWEEGDSALELPVFAAGLALGSWGESQWGRGSTEALRVGPEVGANLCGVPVCRGF